MAIDWTTPIQGMRGRSQGIASIIPLGDGRWKWKVAYKKHSGSGEESSEELAKQAAERLLAVLKAAFEKS